jgi:molybdopterin synthase sulfur carrier subunit
VEVTLRLFAAARQAAGTPRLQVIATTVSEALDAAREKFGAQFSAVLDGSRVWVNGEPADLSARLNDGDEVAVLPPVSGG